MRNKKKQFLVLGLGRFGASVAQNLCRLGHEVLAVDSDEQLVNDVAPYVTKAIQADATDENALLMMGVSDYDAAVVAIGSNIRDSILVTVLCKEAGVPQVIAKAVDELHAKVLRKVGADKVVFPERDMGQRVARLLDTPNILEMMELSDEFQIAEVLVPERWCGHSLAEINVRRDYHLTIVGIRREGVFRVSPGAHEVFQAHDILIVLGRQRDIDLID
ncbi:MAG: TrkA family potassium uptake protein [Clostridia bacterium]|nr:TrkA family potassium uptake protein [Clostridia bacterium]